MTTVADIIGGTPRSERRERVFGAINRMAGYLNVIGFGWLVPILRIAAGDNLRLQLRELWQQAGIPLIGIVVFLAAWAWLAPKVDTSLGAVPGPSQVWEQAVNLYEDHKAERTKAAGSGAADADAARAADSRAAVLTASS